MSPKTLPSSGPEHLLVAYVFEVPTRFGLWRPAKTPTKVSYLMQLIDQLLGGRPPFVAVKAKIASRDAKSNK